MYTQQEIILRFHREGKSQRSISKALKISRKTVSRYIRNYAFLCGKEGAETSFPTSFTTAEKYRVGTRKKRCLTREIELEIDECLSSNMRKCVEGMHKQQLKGIDIHQLLEKKGYKIGYTTICNYIRNKKNKSREAFIRQRYKAGSICEFDWGEIKIKLNGSIQVLHMAVFTSCYSNYRYAKLYHRQNTLAFMDSHVSFFAHISGVYHEMVYDNMRVAVARFVGNKEKEPTQALINLKGHYQFNHRFCNAYRGNEKGHVERSVEYVRRKAFGFQDEFTTIEEAQNYLEEVVANVNLEPCRKAEKSSQILLEEEKQHLWNVPLAYSFHLTEECRVDKYSTICYSTNRYSVPDHLVGKFVTLNIFNDKLELYYNNERLGKHQRSYGAHQWKIKLEHYLDTFHKKPGALVNSEALAQSSQVLKQFYTSYYQDSPRDFIALLLYCRKHKIREEKLIEAENCLLKLSPNHMETEKLIALLGNESTQQQQQQQQSCYAKSEIENQSKLHLKELAGLV